jgi:hypothetical protein
MNYKYVPVYTAYNEISVNGRSKTLDGLNIQDAANQVSKKTILEFYKDAISDKSNDKEDIASMESYIEDFVGDICLHDTNHATIGHGEEEVILVIAPNSPFYNIIDKDQEEWADEINEQWVELFDRFAEDYIKNID